MICSMKPASSSSLSLSYLIFLCIIVGKGDCGDCPVPVPPPNFTVAVTSDIGMYMLGHIIHLIAGQKPDIVVIPGDLGYNENNVKTPEQFMNVINQILDPSVPVFLTKGNHDEYTNHWEQERGYSDLLAQRWEQAGNYAAYDCLGKPGINQSCGRHGVFFTLATHGCESCMASGDWRSSQCRDNKCQAQPGLHEQFLKSAPGLWRLCFWHKNMRKLQVGGKYDEVGYGPYEECRKSGAIIITGHEHSYQRTRTLTSMIDQTVDVDWTFPDKLRVKEGSSFVVNAALGGLSVRFQLRCLDGAGIEFPYGCKQEWGRILTANQSEMAGVWAAALFLQFHVDGNPCKGRARLLSHTGSLLDEFAFYSQIGLSKSCCPDRGFQNDHSQASPESAQSSSGISNSPVTEAETSSSTSTSPGVVVQTMEGTVGHASAASVTVLFLLFWLS